MIYYILFIWTKKKKNHEKKERKEKKIKIGVDTCLDTYQSEEIEDEHEILQTLAAAVHFGSVTHIVADLLFLRPTQNGNQRH